MFGVSCFTSSFMNGVSFFTSIFGVHARKLIPDEEGQQDVADFEDDEDNNLVTVDAEESQSVGGHLRPQN
jgi:hypothetical protein